MIIILDTADGQAYNFRTRKEASEFLGVSRPTLRGWLTNQFYLYRTLIITHTSNEKITKSNRELLKRHIQKIGEDEKVNGKAVDLPGVLHEVGDVLVDSPRSERTPQVDGAN